MIAEAFEDIFHHVIAKARRLKRGIWSQGATCSRACTYVCTQTSDHRCRRRRKNLCSQWTMLGPAPQYAGPRPLVGLASVSEVDSTAASDLVFWKLGPALHRITTPLPYPQPCQFSSIRP